MAFCSKCGFKNSSDARFCEDCGHPLAIEALRATPSAPSSLEAITPSNHASTRKTILIGLAALSGLGAGAYVLLDKNEKPEAAGYSQSRSSDIFGKIGGLLSGFSLPIGGESKLSRDKAKNLIQKYLNHYPVTREIPSSETSLPWDDLPNVVGNRTEAVLSKLADAGVITYAIQPGWITLYNIKITEKGRPYVLKEVQDIGTKKVRTVKLCERQIEEISGIAQQGPNDARVQYTYKTASPTPFGAVAPVSCSGQTIGNQARLTLYDDGWRVVGY